MLKHLLCTFGIGTALRCGSLFGAGSALRDSGAPGSGSKNSNSDSSSRRSTYVGTKSLLISFCSFVFLLFLILQRASLFHPARAHVRMDRLKFGVQNRHLVLSVTPYPRARSFRTRPPAFDYGKTSKCRYSQILDRRNLYLDRFDRILRATCNV